MLDVWGQLPKAQDDSTTIEEYIDSKISAHNLNANAHLDTGGSLDEHRKYEIIDHLEESIVEDKYKLGSIPPEAFSDIRPVLNMNITVGSNWDKSFALDGKAEFTIGHFLMSADNQTNSRVDLTSSLGAFNFLDWTKNFIWQMTLTVSTDTNIIAYWGLCENEQFAGMKDGVFFFMEDGTLYAGVSANDGTEYKETVTAPTFHYSNKVTYRIIYDSVNDKIHYYIDGTLVKTFTNPTLKGWSTALASFHLKTKANEYKTITCFDGLFAS